MARFERGEAVKVRLGKFSLVKVSHGGSVRVGFGKFRRVAVRRG
jgi:hypothetical protein